MAAASCHNPCWRRISNMIMIPCGFVYRLGVTGEGSRRCQPRNGLVHLYHALFRSAFHVLKPAPAPLEQPIASTSPPIQGPG
ncbi:uncharacterized protein UV8b_01785 [Ustilaginoidea virens]|uniref:Uncharacterized protein n=1 Tax=Ustilaginoidea virens TaxID=1159556 RepID=A0A8E5HLF3_USTVR|nr:uncharacterized protein UV8b_01785 [Ustilaginoidea virens]QUC17544.1 hypothetical protein UV8b_01785 [Ustilaginoidea virens]